MTTPFEVDRKLFCKVAEGKNIPIPKGRSSDLFAVVELDNRKKQTPVSSSNINPFWAEEFVFDAVEEVYNQFSVTLFNKASDEDEQDVPVGKVVFPRAVISTAMLDEDQWFALNSVDDENVVSGDIRLRITHFPPEDGFTKHSFSVNVVAAKDLIARSGKSANPYVALHMLPDINLLTTQKTNVEKETLNPSFHHTMVLTTDDMKNPELALHVAVWHAGATEDLFMGNTTIYLSNFVQKSISDRWYKLSPKQANLGNLASLADKMSKLNPEEKNSMTKPKMLVFAIQTAATIAKDKSKKNIHKFAENKFTSTAYCYRCSEVINPFDKEMQCKECRINCHTECSTLVGKNCGLVPLIRLRIAYMTMAVFPIAKYEKFLDVLTQDNYALCTLFGFVIQEREDLARCLIRIFEQRGKVLEFISALMKNEVDTSPNVSTMFRANSMASKAVDVYMKHVGMPYLKMVLGSIVEKIAKNGISTEVDPLRLKNKRNMDKNWKELKTYMNEITDQIFSTHAQVPAQFRQMFEYLQSQVIKKFPNDKVVRYTSVAGFIFLRYFTPALLSPKLFDLLPQLADEKTSRTFTLLAKTLQNLANLVEFGEKEAYMKPMNEFILSKMKDMKQYIDAISSTKPGPGVVFKPCPVESPKVNLAQEAAGVFEIVVKSTDKIVENVKSGGHRSIISLLSDMKKIMIELDKLPTQANSNGSNLARIKMIRDEEKIKSNSVEDLSASEVVKRARSNSAAQAAAAAANAAQTKKGWTLFKRKSSSSGTNAVMEGVTEVPQVKEEEEVATTPISASNSPTMATKDNIPAMPTSPSSPTVAASLASPSPQGNTPAPGAGGREFVRRVSNAGSAMTSSSTNSSGVCDVCKSPTEGNMTIAFGKVFHPEHYICSVCSTSLADDPKRTYADGKLFCKEHALGKELPLLMKRTALKSTTNSALTGRDVCFGCKKGIAENGVTVGETKKYHAECLICVECHKPLDAAAFEVDESQPYCHADYQEITGAACGACHDPIKPKDEVIALGKRRFHRHCKKCDQCGALFTSKTAYFTTAKLSVLCTKHKSEFADCRQCKDKITDARVLIALKKQYNYHPEHFNCATCSVNLEKKQFFERAEVPYCIKCYFDRVILEFASYK